MAYVNPNSTIELFAGVPLNKDAEDTLYFASRADQNVYFGGLTKMTLSEYSYIRTGSERGGAIRIAVTAASQWANLFKVNYLRFKNTSHENKWFYAFVTGVLYVSEECAEISYEFDDLQTWLPGVDYTLTECHIIRQHQTGSDNLGDNTEPETIQVPTYHPAVIKYVNEKEYFEDTFDIFENGYYIAMMLPRTHQGSELFYGYYDAMSDDYKLLNGEGDVPFMQIIDGVPCNNMIVLLDTSDTYIPQIGDDDYDPDLLYMPRWWVRFIKINRYWGEYIYKTWVIPKDFVNTSYVDENVTLSTGSTISSALYKVKPGVLFNYTITFAGGGSAHYTAQYDGDINVKSVYKFFNVTHSVLNRTYTVKNNKLNTNPFAYFEISVPNGQDQILSFEDMRADLQESIVNPLVPNVAHEPYIKIVGSLLDDKISMIPYGYNYKKFSFDKQNGLPTPPVGVSKGVIDTSVPTSLLSSVIELGTTAVGAALGGPAGSAISQVATGGAMAITQNTMPQGTSNIYNLSNVTMWAEKIRYFVGVYMLAENYEKIDAFFDAYGYTQNKFASPDISHRQYWTYIQTADANFMSISTPAEALRRINERFNDGIRFHKGAATIGNLHSYTNAIIS